MRVSWAGVALGLVLALASLALKAIVPGDRGTVQLVAGESVDFGPASLCLEDFRVLKYPGGKPRQFESDVVVAVPGDERVEKVTVSVNHPLRWRGWWIYQSGYDAIGERETTLLFFRDPWLPLAVLAGALLLLGTLGLAVSSRPVPRPTSPPAGVSYRVVRWIMAVLVVGVPLFIVGRAVLRPEPVAALQSPLMAPHVAAYVASYIIMVFAAFGIGRRWLPLGFFLMTLGLVLGAAWGKICWGDFWQYDPKEMWSLATWLVYFAYFPLRRFPRVERTLRIAGAALVILTATWANFSKFFVGLHSYV